MIKFSKITDHAVVCLGFLAEKPWYSLPVTKLSKETGLELNKVQKLLKLLFSKRNLMRTNI